MKPLSSFKQWISSIGSRRLNHTGYPCDHMAKLQSSSSQVRSIFLYSAGCTACSFDIGLSLDRLCLLLRDEETEEAHASVPSNFSLRVKMKGSTSNTAVLFSPCPLRNLSLSLPLSWCSHGLSVPGNVCNWV